MYKPFDVFAFFAGLVFIQVKYFWNRQVEIVCPVASILQSVVYIYICLCSILYGTRIAPFLNKVVCTEPNTAKKFESILT